MALLNIIKEGDETLRRISRPVENITPRIITLLDDMRETLADADGVGLAAPQVGVLRQVVLVVDTSDNDRIYELINPEIIDREGEQEDIEGCLSIPGTWAITHRPLRVVVRATDRDGNEFTVTGEGLTARAFCHEIDHLSGKLFTDNALHILTPEEVQKIMG